MSRGGQQYRCDADAVRGGAFAHALPAVSVKVWRIAGGNAYPLEVTAQDIPEAVNEGAPFCNHKDFLAVLHGHSGKGKKALHLYAIKQQSRPNYRKNPQTGLTESFRPLYADPLFSMTVNDFNPVEPFKWTPGCDAVGIDRTLIEGGQ